MSRPSLREPRRRQLAAAYARVLAAHGQNGASVAAVALEAGVAPGLVHHYFQNKGDLQAELLRLLLANFRSRTSGRPMRVYAEAALALGESSDLVAARAWVSLFAEALSDPALFDKLRRALDAEVAAIERKSRLSPENAAAVLAFIVGALVFGAFAPRKTHGFAAPSLQILLKALGA